MRVAGQDKAQPMWSWCFYQTNWKICITSYMWYVYIQIEVSTVHSLAMDAVPAGTKPHLFFRESSVVCSSSPLPFLEEPPGYAPSFHFRRGMWGECVFVGVKEGQFKNFIALWMSSSLHRRNKEMPRREKAPSTPISAALADPEMGVPDVPSGQEPGAR